MVVKFSLMVLVFAATMDVISSNYHAVQYENKGELDGNTDGGSSGKTSTLCKSNERVFRRSLIKFKKLYRLPEPPRHLNPTTASPRHLNPTTASPRHLNPTTASPVVMQFGGGINVERRFGEPNDGSIHFPDATDEKSEEAIAKSNCIKSLEQLVSESKASYLEKMNAIENEERKNKVEVSWKLAEDHLKMLIAIETMLPEKKISQPSSGWGIVGGVYIMCDIYVAEIAHKIYTPYIDEIFDLYYEDGLAARQSPSP